MIDLTRFVRFKGGTPSLRRTELCSLDFARDKVLSSGFLAQFLPFFTENKKRRVPSFLGQETRFEKPVHGVSHIRHCFIRKFLYNKLVVMAKS